MQTSAALSVVTTETGKLAAIARCSNINGIYQSSVESAVCTSGLNYLIVCTAAFSVVGLFLSLVAIAYTHVLRKRLRQTRSGNTPKLSPPTHHAPQPTHKRGPSMGA